MLSLVNQYRRECQAAAYATGWDTEERARMHEAKAKTLWSKLVDAIGEEEAKMEVFS